jgi:hypothetical protein
VVPGALPRVSLRVPLGATLALLFATSGFRLRLGFRLLRLCLSPLPLRFPTLLFAATLLSAAGTLLFVAGTLLFVAAVRPFVALTAPLFGAFGALLGMAAPTPLPTGFRVRVGDWNVGQGKRTADRDRAPLSTSVSRGARHVPARSRVPCRARERS